METKIINLIKSTIHKHTEFCQLGFVNNKCPGGNDNKCCQMMSSECSNVLEEYNYQTLAQNGDNFFIKVRFNA